jgi:hypothetical protein
MYCPDFFEKKNRRYVKPLSPRLKNTIFTMSKKELKITLKMNRNLLKILLKDMMKIDH